MPLAAATITPGPHTPRPVHFDPTQTVPRPRGMDGEVSPSLHGRVIYIAATAATAYLVWTLQPLYAIVAAVSWAAGTVFYFSESSKESTPVIRTAEEAKAMWTKTPGAKKVQDAEELEESWAFVTQCLIGKTEEYTKEEYANLRKDEKEKLFNAEVPMGYRTEDGDYPGIWIVLGSQIERWAEEGFVRGFRLLTEEGKTLVNDPKAHERFYEKLQATNVKRELHKDVTLNLRKAKNAETAKLMIALGASTNNADENGDLFDEAIKKGDIKLIRALKTRHTKPLNGGLQPSDPTTWSPTSELPQTPLEQLALTAHENKHDIFMALFPDLGPSYATKPNAKQFHLALCSHRHLIRESLAETLFEAVKQASYASAATPR